MWLQLPNDPLQEETSKACFTNCQFVTEEKKTRKNARTEDIVCHHYAFVQCLIQSGKEYYSVFNVRRSDIHVDAPKKKTYT